MMAEFLDLFCLFLMASGGLAWAAFFALLFYVWLSQPKGKKL